MLVQVVQATHWGDHRVRLRFNDGVEGDLDLSHDLWGEVFEPPRDPAGCSRFVVDHPLTWPKGADFAPEFLHRRVLAAARLDAPGR